MEVIKNIDREMMRIDIPDFIPGDTVKVFVKIKEGEKERLQAFQGVVIGKRRGNMNAMFTVRKVSGGIGVERIFPLASPFIESITINKKGVVKLPHLF